MTDPMTPTEQAARVLADVRKSTQNPPSVEYLRKRLRYDPDTGKLFWLDYEGMPKKWRTRYAGKEALTCNSGPGYLTGDIDNVKFRAHRVVWALHYGKWPSAYLDHINGIKSDNRICNLKEVSQQENCQNLSMRSDSTTGLTGVFWNNLLCKWQAHIKKDGQKFHLGSFATMEEAVAARSAGIKLLGFSERHGAKSPMGQRDASA